ncbi:hypothetical protein [Bacillus sp. ISL-45]|uniref:hypothetical protein n=1 Tax=Bacillus sp. ISL-45 TaxID=2819128 RepID=UPI001BEA7EFF|nr:hypothetical protein [Bacillus sp. ISL-45]MBT2661637.1 hypothetical protein [Bacillus sp. ISL-45]
MSIYQNIFHYYRGQSKNSSEASQVLQVENKVTKAFLNVLQHSSYELTLAFLRFLGLELLSGEEHFEYLHQTSSQLPKATPFAAIVGIAESKELKVGTSRQYGIPDGAIISKEVSLLIENKIGYNSYLDVEQLNRHKAIFPPNQVVKVHPIILTWKEVRDFFKKQYKPFEEKSDILTCFLLEQFEEFCTINCIGDKQKSKEYFFLRFEKAKARELARHIDSYIWNSPEFNVIDAGTNDGIGYKIAGKPKFATLTTQRQRCLILHIGQKEQKLGLQIQSEIDKQLGIQYPRRTMNISNTHTKHIYV